MDGEASSLVSSRVAIRPMDPSAWRGVDARCVLHLRERVGQTLGVATVIKRIDVPNAAPLRLDVVPLRPGEVYLEHRITGADLQEVPGGAA